MFKLTKNNLLLFFYSILSYFKINIIGQLAFNELLSLLVLFSIKSLMKILKNNEIKNILTAYGIFLISQIISDFYNESEFTDYSRGWANIVFAMFTFIFLSQQLRRNPTIIILFLLGTSLRYIFLGDSANSTFSIDLNDMSFFKFRLTNALNPIILIISWYILKKGFRNINIVILIFIFYAMFCLVFNSRSNALLFILSSIILKYKKQISGVSLKRLLSYFILFTIILQSLYSVYIYEVIRGNIGASHTKIQIKNVENPYNPFELLLIGRSEVVIAFDAIFDKPIWGHGSWAIDKGGKYMSKIYTLQKNSDMFQRILSDQSEKFRIPSHSILFGAWMNAGIIGFLAVSYIFLLFVKKSIWIIRDFESSYNPFIPIIIFFLLNGIWLFLFSPLPHIKITLPIILSFNLTYSRILKYNKFKTEINR